MTTQTQTQVLGVPRDDLAAAQLGIEPPHVERWSTYMVWVE
jgi:hypothetical protein